MKCPVCQATLSPCSYGDQTIDLCKQCGGVWFDSKEIVPAITALASRDETPGLHAKDALQFSPPLNPPAEQEKLCPRCTVFTNIFNYSYDSNIFLNSCPSCQGIWADKGELQHLAQYSKGNPTVKALAKDLAEFHSHKKSPAHKLLTSRLLSGLVAGLYLVVAIVFRGTEATRLLTLPSCLHLVFRCHGKLYGNHDVPRTGNNQKISRYHFSLSRMGSSSVAVDSRNC